MLPTTRRCAADPSPHTWLARLVVCTGIAAHVWPPIWKRLPHPGLHPESAGDARRGRGRRRPCWGRACPQVLSPCWHALSERCGAAGFGGADGTAGSGVSNGEAGGNRAGGGGTGSCELPSMTHSAFVPSVWIGLASCGNYTKLSVTPLMLSRPIFFHPTPSLHYTI